MLTKIILVTALEFHRFPFSHLALLNHWGLINASPFSAQALSTLTWSEPCSDVLESLTRELEKQNAAFSWDTF